MTSQAPDKLINKTNLNLVDDQIFSIENLNGDTEFSLLPTVEDLKKLGIHISPKMYVLNTSISRGYIATYVLESDGRLLFNSYKVPKSNSEESEENYVHNYVHGNFKLVLYSINNGDHNVNTEGKISELVFIDGKLNCLDSKDSYIKIKNGLAMKTTSKQIRILIASAIIFVSMGVFPPWTYTIDANSIKSEKPAGYALIIEPPKPEKDGLYFGVKLDISRLIIQWLILCAATGGLVLLTKEFENNRTN